MWPRAAYCLGTRGTRAFSSTSCSTDRSAETPELRYLEPNRDTTVVHNLGQQSLHLSSVPERLLHCLPSGRRHTAARKPAILLLPTPTQRALRTAHTCTVQSSTIFLYAELKILRSDDRGREKFRVFLQECGLVQRV